MKLSPLVPIALVLSTGLPLAALAAGPAAPNYDIGGALKEAKPPPPPVETPQAPLNLQQPEEPPLELEDGETLFVRSFRLDGVEFADEAQVQALVASFTGHDLGLAEILTAANRITSFYRDRGYLVAKAYVPQQDARSGVLTIRIVVGRHGRLTVDNRSPLAASVAEGFLENAGSSGEPIRQDKLERAMLLVSDLPGITTPNVTIAPGALPGTSDLHVEVPGTRRVEGYALGDNYGSRYTGRKRLNMGATLNAPLGIGDKLSVSGVTSPAAGLQGGRVSYAFPIGWDGLRLEMNAGRVTYKLGDSYSDTEALGYADFADGTFSYPILRSDPETLQVSLNLGGRRLQDKVWGETTSHRKVSAARLGLLNQTSGTLFGLTLRTQASGIFTVGRLSFYDAQQRADNEAGVHTAGEFTKAEFELGGSLGLTEELSLSTSLKTQKAIGKNLDSSEQMTISGYGAVIGQAPGIMGDNGYLYNAELKYALPGLVEGHKHSVGLFTDVGRVYLEDAEYTTNPHSYRAADLGLSYSAQFAYADERYLIANLKLAHNLGPRPDGAEIVNRTKLLAQIGLTF